MLRHSPRQTGRLVVLLAIGAALGACGEEDPGPTRVTLDELCASPESYEGRELSFDIALATDRMFPVLMSAAGCWPENPCCNSTLFAYAVACPQQDVPIIVSPGLTSLSDPLQITCQGVTAGTIPAECVNECDTTLVDAVRSVRGTLSAEREPDFRFGPRRRVLEVTAVERAPIPDAGPTPDAGAI